MQTIFATISEELEDDSSSASIDDAEEEPQKQRDRSDKIQNCETCGKQSIFIEF